MASHTISIEQIGTQLPARKGTILDAALAAGVPFPHGCRIGECGACKSRLIAGEVHSEPPADPAILTPSERAAGVILPCRSWPKSDVTIAWLDDVDVDRLAPVRHVSAAVVGLEDLTHDIKRVLLELRGPPLEFEAGQYCLLQFGDLPGRSYSMANCPDEPVLEFHVRRRPEGLASRYVAEQLRLGDVARLEGPFGTATLRRSYSGPMVAAAGGSGLAPIRSIVRTALARTASQEIHCYFGAREERDVYCESELRALADAHPNFRLEIVLSATQCDCTRRSGLVHEAIAADFPRLDGTKLYVAGPPPMVDAVAATAKSRGAQPQDIHADAFTAAPTPQQGRSPLGRICSLFKQK